LAVQHVVPDGTDNGNFYRHAAALYYRLGDKAAYQAAVAKAVEAQLNDDRLARRGTEPGAAWLLVARMQAQIGDDAGRRQSIANALDAADERRRQVVADYDRNRRYIEVIETLVELDDYPAAVEVAARLRTFCNPDDATNRHYLIAAYAALGDGESLRALMDSGKTPVERRLSEQSLRRLSDGGHVEALRLLSLGERPIVGADTLARVYGEHGQFGPAREALFKLSGSARKRAAEQVIAQLIAHGRHDEAMQMWANIDAADVSCTMWALMAPTLVRTGHAEQVAKFTSTHVRTTDDATWACVLHTLAAVAGAHHQSGDAAAAEAARNELLAGLSEPRRRQNTTVRRIEVATILLDAGDRASAAEVLRPIRDAVQGGDLTLPPSQLLELFVRLGDMDGAWMANHHNVAWKDRTRIMSLLAAAQREAGDMDAALHTARQHGLRGSMATLLAHRTRTGDPRGALRDALSLHASRWSPFRPHLMLAVAQALLGDKDDQLIQPNEDQPAY
jgi:hypothetical protein